MDRTREGPHHHPGHGTRATEWPVLCESYFLRYSEEVREAARAVLGPRPACDDIVQEVFLRLLGNPTAFPLSKRYFRVAGRNAALNHLRSQGRADALARRLVPRPPIPPEGPLERLQSEQRRRRVAEAIETLPPRCRAVARRTWLQGWSAAQVANDLGMTVKRVERHRATARERLRIALVVKRSVGSPGGGRGVIRSS